MFDDRIARREAAQFRRRGLPVRSRRLLAAIESATALEGRTALEIGAGIGGLTVTLLERGVARASIVDASQAYVRVARDLAADRGVADRLDITLGDFTDVAPALQPVDIVALDRVVCCYPVWENLLRTAAQKASRVIALTWPRDAWWTRFGVRVINLVLRLRRTEFRVFVHSTSAMRALLQREGFTTRVVAHRGPWEIVLGQK